LSALRYDQINEYDLGRATSWSAKGLLAKVYLTNNRKAEALNQLMDIKNNSVYGLQAVYKDVFSINKEMNNEILFTVRYKSGGYGLGSDFGNDFSPSGSGNAVINGAGSQHNYPTQEYYDYVASISGDTRTAVNLGIFFNGRSELWYVNKFLYPVIISHDGESDWPVLRYSDILLMIAEASGYSAESVDLINLVRVRAGLPAHTMSVISTTAKFEKALSDERRLEFAFENQRFFDLVRFNTTLTTIRVEDVMKAHFALEYPGHYGKYPYPRLTLEQLQANVTPEHLLLPIPQREIDTNSDITIEQNPGY
jgi:hypothetical protein